MSRFCHETCVKEVEGNIFLSNRIKQSKMKCTALRSIKLPIKDIHVTIMVLYVLWKIVFFNLFKWYSDNRKILIRSIYG